MTDGYYSLAQIRMITKFDEQWKLHSQTTRNPYSFVCLASAKTIEPPWVITESFFRINHIVLSAHNANIRSRTDNCRMECFYLKDETHLWRYALIRYIPLCAHITSWTSAKKKSALKSSTVAQWYTASLAYKRLPVRPSYEKTFH